MDYCRGGTLLKRLNQTEFGLPEDTVKKYFRSLVSAIHYCHEVWNIAHRDIKPENIMLSKKDGTEEIYLCDFGCSEFFHPKKDKLSNATKGTYLFMAPEIFEVGAAEKVVRGRQSDIWSAGITLFNLLTNSFPFKGRNMLQLVENVKTKSPDLDKLGPGQDQLKNLLRCMLERDPEKRMSIYDVISDPWVTNDGVESVDLDLEASEDSLSDVSSHVFLTLKDESQSTAA